MQYEPMGPGTIDIMSGTSLYSPGFIGSEYSQYEQQHRQFNEDEDNRHKHKAKNI